MLIILIVSLIFCYIFLPLSDGNPFDGGKKTIRISSAQVG